MPYVQCEDTLAGTHNALTTVLEQWTTTNGALHYINCTHVHQLAGVARELKLQSHHLKRIKYHHASTLDRLSEIVNHHHNDWVVVERILSLTGENYTKDNYDLVQLVQQHPRLVVIAPANPFLSQLLST